MDQKIIASSSPSPLQPTRFHKNRKLVTVLAIGLVIGLAFGIFIGKTMLSSLTGVGTNNQVQVSGTVPDKTSGTLYFANLDGTIQASTSITNGEYSVLLVGGESYTISNGPSAGYILNKTFYAYENYNTFYVPSGVSTFTQNLVPK